MLIPVNTICEVVGGKLISWQGHHFVKGGNCLIHNLKPGELYFPWRVRNFREIVKVAKRFKVAGIVWDEKIPKNYNKEINLILVKNIEQAFINFAAYYRSLFNLPVVGITGSAGKTTVKELVFAILSRRFNTLKGYENYNIAVLNSWNLTRLTPQHQAAVLEVAMTAPGSIKAQCEIIKPKIGLITRIGSDHYSYHGSINSIIKTKGEIIAGLPADGYLILNADDVNSKKLDCTGFPGTILFFGIKNPAHFQAKEIKYLMKGTRFIARTPVGRIKIDSPLLGEHNVYNILASLAVGYLFNIPLAEMSKAVNNLTGLEGRFQILSGYHNTLVINDTFSANPNSMAAAIETTKEIYPDREKIAVLAPMYLLGQISAREHYNIGKKVAATGFTKLITLGKGGRYIMEGALNNGMPENKIFHCKTREQAGKILRKIITPGAVVLFKGGMYSKLGLLCEKFGQKYPGNFTGG